MMLASVRIDQRRQTRMSRQSDYQYRRAQVLANRAEQKEAEEYDQLKSAYESHLSMKKKNKQAKQLAYEETAYKQQQRGEHKNAILARKAEIARAEEKLRKDTERRVSQKA